MENEKEKNNERKEGKFNLDLGESIIIGFIVLAVSVVLGSYIVANSISNIKIYGSSSSSSSQLQTYLQTLQQVPLPNITNIDPVYGNPNNVNVIVYEFSDYAVHTVICFIYKHFHKLSKII